MPKNLTDAEFECQTKELSDQIGRLVSGKETVVVTAALVTMAVAVLLQFPPGERLKGALKFHEWLLMTLEDNPRP